MEDAGYIRREYRDVIQQGILHNNIMFIEPAPLAILAITHPSVVPEVTLPLSPTSDTLSPTSDTLSPVGDIFNEYKITPEITPEITPKITPETTTPPPPPPRHRLAPARPLASSGSHSRKVVVVVVVVVARTKGKPRATWQI